MIELPAWSIAVTEISTTTVTGILEHLNGFLAVANQIAAFLLSQLSSYSTWNDYDLDRSNSERERERRRGGGERGKERGRERGDEGGE